KGVLVQTRRHALICSLLGIRHVILAVNKIDLVGFEQSTFDRIRQDFESFAAELKFKTIAAVPISARYGDNVTARSSRTPWYSGPTLLDGLETIEVDQDIGARPFRFPVQWVNRPNLDFRGYAGTVMSGSVKPGDVAVVAVSGQQVHIKDVLTAEGPQPVANAG